MPQRFHLDVVGHRKLELAAVSATALPVNNIVIKAQKPEDEWLQESMELIGEWRAIFRSIYIKWALAINGLHVALEPYSNPAWQDNNQFAVSSLRTEATGRLKPVQIAVWDGPETKKDHEAVISYIAGWGIIDLASALEEFIFDLCRVYHWQHTEHLTRVPEFKDLRRLRADSVNSADHLAKWEAAFTARLENWQRNAAYTSKRDLFLSCCNYAGLKMPSTYKHTTPETWADCLNGVFILSLIHPNATVPKELADFSASKLNLGYDL